MMQNDSVEYRCGGVIIVSGPSPFDDFPEGCISNIISFTSPRDACMVASVSKTFELAVKSDIIWEKFLPQDYSYLVPQWRDFSSKKELFFALCNEPVLIDYDRKSFWLEKSSGKRCIMLSAMNLLILDADDPEYWDWITIPESSMPIEARVGFVGQEASTKYICFDDRGPREPRMDVVAAKEREDGWMEIEIGEFYNEGGLTDCDEIKMSALETKELNWKRGLIIQGIEFRPAKSW